MFDMIKNLFVYRTLSIYYNRCEVEPKGLRQFYCLLKNSRVYVYGKHANYYKVSFMYPNIYQYTEQLKKINNGLRKGTYNIPTPNIKEYSYIAVKYWLLNEQREIPTRKELDTLYREFLEEAIFLLKWCDENRDRAHLPNIGYTLRLLSGYIHNLESIGSVIAIKK